MEAGGEWGSCMRAVLCSRGPPRHPPFPPPLEATNIGGPLGGGLGGQWCLWRRRHSLSHQDVIYRPALTLLHSQSLPLIFCDPPSPPTPMTALLSLPLLVFQVCREKKVWFGESWEGGKMGQIAMVEFLVMTPPSWTTQTEEPHLLLRSFKSDQMDPEVQQKMFLCLRWKISDDADVSKCFSWPHWEGGWLAKRRAGGRLSDI